MFHNTHKRGIILANIGSPQRPTTRDVARYLTEFLMDPDVIELPWVLRFSLVRGLIVPFRSPKSAQKYAKIWTQRGSPLLVHTQDLAKQLENALSIPVRVGMRYGEPSLAHAVTQLAEQDVQEFDLVPMFPQYARATSLSVTKAFTRALSQQLGVKNGHSAGHSARVLDEFFHREEYAHAMSALLQAHPSPWQTYDHMLFSFHGLPRSAVQKDPQCQLGNCCLSEQSCERRCYRAQCVMTATKLATRWKVPKEKWSLSFQSRLGFAKWIGPYTEQRLRTLAASGTRSVLLLCPAFATDCLETLEEIHMEMKDLFLSLGGTTFDVVPCLNASPQWITSLAQLCRQDALWRSLPLNIEKTVKIG